MTATEAGPTLTVVETQTLHDGEPMHWWQWSEAPAVPAPAEAVKEDEQ